MNAIVARIRRIDMEIWIIIGLVAIIAALIPVWIIAETDAAADCAARGGSYEQVDSTYVTTNVGNGQSITSEIPINGCV